MRRIDLICKLAGPFAIALIDGISTEVAILVNFGMNVGSVAAEYYAIAKVKRSQMLLFRWEFLPSVLARSTKLCQAYRSQDNFLQMSPCRHDRKPIVFHTVGDTLKTVFSQCGRNQPSTSTTGLFLRRSPWRYFISPSFPSAARW